MNDDTRSRIHRLSTQLRRLGVEKSAGEFPALVDKAHSLRSQAAELRRDGETTWAAVVTDMAQTGTIAEHHVTAVATAQVATAAAPANGNLFKAIQHAEAAVLREAEAAAREMAPKIRVDLAARAAKVVRASSKLKIPAAVRNRSEAFDAAVHPDTWAEADRLAREFDTLHDCYRTLRQLGWLPGLEIGDARFRYRDSYAASQLGVAPPLRLLAAIRAGADPGLYSEEAARQHQADGIERAHQRREEELRR